MSSQRIRLRGGKPRRSGPYPLGQIPNSVLVEVGKQVVHRLAVGLGDITGDDFGTIFAEAVQGVHGARPFGIADVVSNGCAWSVKTVKSTRPFRVSRVRLISGRNSPDFSAGIENPHDDPAATGAAVLSIWNARVDEAMDQFEDLRVAVLIRNIAAREFLLFEEEAHRYPPGDYCWSFNKNENLEGRERATGRHCFTWQPHGSQFTIIRDIPGSSRRFSITPNIPMVDPQTVLDNVGFAPIWVSIHS